MFKKAVIVGTGLIGGSIALDLKKKNLSREVLGISRHAKNLKIARSIGAIDRGSCSLDILKGADLVILATPVETILKLAPKISRIVGPECLVTDVGSTKAQVAAKLSRLFPNYVGSHPLAGSEKRGIEHARPGIFKKYLCILTPTRSTRLAALNKIALLWKKLGGRVVKMDPVTHDKILAFTSHLPHVCAFSLMSAQPSRFLKFSSSGLKDTTRLASSDAELWADIFLSNRRNLSKSITQLERELSKIRSALAKTDHSRIVRLLKTAAKKRAALLSSS